MAISNENTPTNTNSTKPRLPEVPNQVTEPIALRKFLTAVRNHLRAAQETTTRINQGGSGSGGTPVGPNFAVQSKRNSNFYGDAGLLYGTFPTDEPGTLITSDVDITTGALPNMGMVMIGYCVADNSILYGCRDGFIRKFSCTSRTVVGVTAAVVGSFGSGGGTICSNISNNKFVLRTTASTPGGSFQVFSAISMLLLDTYTIGGSIGAVDSNLLYDQSTDSVWTSEATNLYHYRLAAGTRTVIPALTVAACKIHASGPGASAVVYMDGTNLGTVNPTTDVAILSVAVTTILVCAVAADGMAVDPDGYIWFTCAGFNFSGHVYKVDPTTLATLASVGNHNGGLGIRPSTVNAIPVPNAVFAFSTIEAEKVVLIGGDGYWDLALVNRDTTTVIGNRMTTPALNANGAGLFAFNNGTCGVAAGGGSLWAFCNDTGTGTALEITQIGLDIPETEMLLVSELGNVGGDFVLITRDGRVIVSGLFTALADSLFGEVPTLPAQAANKVWAGPTAGADAVPTFRELVADDIPFGGAVWGDITGLLSDQTDLSTALAAKAPLASPTFTGDPKAPTPSVGDNDTSVATTAFVQAALAAMTQVIGFPFGGGPSAGATTGLYTVVVPSGFTTLTFAASFVGAYGQTLAVPATTQTFTIKKRTAGGVTTTLGTVAISSAGVFTFATTGGVAQTAVSGDLIYIVAPNPIDPTIADFAFTLIAVRS